MILITYGGGDIRWRLNANRLLKQSRRFPFTHRFAFSNSSRSLKKAGALERDLNFIAENVKGNGFWLWKPIIISWALKSFPGQSICYLDAGCEFNYSPKSIDTFREWSLQASEGISSFWEVEDDFREIQYTKKAVLDKFALSSDQLNARQILAGAMIVSNNASTRGLVEEWLSMARFDDYSLLDNSSFCEENVEFVKHRNDQSLFSCLLKSHRIVPKTNQVYFGPNWELDGSNFPIWTIRNRKVVGRQSSNFILKSEELILRIYSSLK